MGNVTYLDHAASTPMRPEAVEAMMPYLSDVYANPSGSHRFARLARRAIDESRDRVAAVLGCAPGEVVFTGCGTESDNMAIGGALAAARLRATQGTTSILAPPVTTPSDAVTPPGVTSPRQAPSDVGSPDLSVCSAAEHHAVLEVVERHHGLVVGVDSYGRIDLDLLTATLSAASDEGRRVAVVSVMAVNNEVGSISDLAAAASVVRRHAPEALFHTDAVQAASWLDLRTITPLVDLLALSAHKFGGPKGVGVLVERGGPKVEPLIIGGGQERERRSGTHNVAGIVAMAEALASTDAERAGEVARLSSMRDGLVAGLLGALDDVIETVPPEHKVAGSAHVCIGGIESEALLFLLDEADVCASAASACASGAMEPSHVLAAMGIDRTLAMGALRLSLGHTTTDADVDRAIEVIVGAVTRLRR